MTISTYLDQNVVVWHPTSQAATILVRRKVQVMTNAGKPGAFLYANYDRCLLMLVTFKTRAEAETYQKEHGGRVLNYAQAVQSVKE